MTTTGDGPRAPRAVVALPSADRDTIALEGTEPWLGTEIPDDPLLAEPGDEPLE